MNKHIAIRWGIASCLWVLASGPAAAQTEVVSPPDPWVHAATGTQFPAALGSSQRGRVYEFDEDGRDASVGYLIEKDGYRATMTIYVYPAKPQFTCEQYFADARSQIEKYDGARVTREGKAPAPSGSGGPVALHAGYSIPAGSMHEDIPAVRSDLYLYCSPDGEWLVKYRATWPEESDFANEVETLLHRIPWPEDLEG